MTAPSRFPPNEIELDLPDDLGTFLFKLPGTQVAKLQESCGWVITYPDGATGRVPKRLGAIVREHLTGVRGLVQDVPFEELDVDSYAGEYDATDTRQVIIHGMIGGARGVVNNVPVEVTDAYVRRLYLDRIEEWPQEAKWKLAVAILFACTQGFTPPKVDGEDSGGPPGNG